MPTAKARTSILIIDTDEGVRWSLEKGLSKSGYQVFTAPTQDEGIDLLQKHPIAAVLVELMPEARLTADTVSLLAQVAHMPRIICTSIDAAPHIVIDCVRRGASDFLPKPFSLAEVRAGLARVLQLDPERELPGAGGGDVDESSLLVGVSTPMQELRSLIREVANTNFNCLVRGESGVGKDIVAREIHRLSKRHSQPFVKVNCSALPDQLLESELFGFEKGAFTGAVNAKPGRFALADKGAIFLDEVCEMHPSVQAKLLQVIEEKQFTKLGGRHAVKVDVQIIAATNADIEQRIKDGLFRQDLHFRLNEFCLWAPPLAERREDIPLLVRHFVQKYGYLAGSRAFELSAEDIDDLCAREWPGNVRELESTVKRWMVLGRKGAGQTQQPTGIDLSGDGEADLERAAAPMNAEADQILKALEAHRWNRMKTARALGMSYQSLRRRIAEYNLEAKYSGLQG